MTTTKDQAEIKWRNEGPDNDKEHRKGSRQPGGNLKKTEPCPQRVNRLPFEKSAGKKKKKCMPCTSIVGKNFGYPLIELEEGTIDDKGVLDLLMSFFLACGMTFLTCCPFPIVL